MPASIRALIEQLGIKVDDEAVSKADLYICPRADMPSPFEDNLTGTCVDCGHPIIFRPYAPASIPKVCIQCGVKRLEALP